MRRHGLFSPALCPQLKESDKGPTLNRTVTLSINCDTGRGLEETSLPEDPVCPRPFSGTYWPARGLWPTRRRLGIPRGAVERRSGGKRGFLTTLPCLYFETYHTCAKNPNERNGKRTVKGKRALMGKMGCDAAKFDPISPSPQQATETLGKQSARKNPPHPPPPPIKLEPAPNPSPRREAEGVETCPPASPLSS